MKADQRSHDEICVNWNEAEIRELLTIRAEAEIVRQFSETVHGALYTSHEMSRVFMGSLRVVCECTHRFRKITGSVNGLLFTINAEKYIEILEHNMLPSRRHLFQGRPCIFQQDNAKPHSAHITKSWLRRKRVRVLDWPACSPDLSPIENVWRILKRKMRQRRPRTVAHLKTCLQEEWDKITPETLHHLVSSVPKRLLSVVKRNGNITKW